MHRNYQISTDGQIKDISEKALKEILEQMMDNGLFRTKVSDIWHSYIDASDGKWCQVPDTDIAFRAV